MSFVGGAISVTAASGLAMSARANWVPMLVSYAIGALLGASFLEVLPHAVEASDNVEQTCAIVLGGILLFFVLEKMVLWRHCHADVCEVHDFHHDTHAHAHNGHNGDNHGHDERRDKASAMLILIGDGCQSVFYVLFKGLDAYVPAHQREFLRFAKDGQSAVEMLE